MVRTPEDDPQLIAGLRAGDAAALAEIYRRYAPRLHEVAYRLLRTTEDAEDTVHDVFVGLPDLVKRYEERGSFPAWIARVCARVALSRLRSRHARTTIPLENATLAVGSSDRESTRLSVQEAIAALPTSLRVVFVLKVVEGYSHAEIGQMVGISAKASDVRLSRAVKRLRVALGE